MHDLLKATKKTKLSLTDYDFQEDIKNRLLLKRLNKDSLLVLEEILCNTPKFPVESLAEDLELPVDTLYKIIDSLVPLNLFQFDGRFLTVDKDKRKYFEAQITRFEDDFKPDLDFFQNLLKSLPIEVLPNWYHVPRTSNNIFQSIIEKHLFTPQVYQRYFIEFSSGNDIISQIISKLFNSPKLKLYVKPLLKEFDLSPEEFEEIVLHLEFNILAFVSFEQEHEILTPLYEWQQYQLFLKDSTPLSATDEVQALRKYEYAFIQDMSDLINLAATTPLELFYNREKETWAPTTPTQTLIETHLGAPKKYIAKLIDKLLILGLAIIEKELLIPTKAAQEWQEIPITQRAHITFKHPHNFLSTQKSYPLATQRVIIEIQKSLSLVKTLSWVLFDDFLKGSLIPLSEDRQVSLKKTGRNWAYALPQYTKEERDFIEYIVCDWLFESGVTQIGKVDGQTAFKLTSLGKSIVI